MSAELKVGETIKLAEIKPIPGVEFLDAKGQPVVSCVEPVGEIAAATPAATTEGAAAATPAVGPDGKPVGRSGRRRCQSRRWRHARRGREARCRRRPRGGCEACRGWCQARRRRQAGRPGQEVSLLFSRGPPALGIGGWRFVL